MAFLYCYTAKYLNNLKVKTDFYRPSDKQISYVTLAEYICSPKTLETRWRRPEEKLQDLTQNLIYTCSRRLTLWLTMAFCSGTNENTPTHSGSTGKGFESSQRLPLKHKLRETSQPVETCAAVNETEPQSAWNVVCSWKRTGNLYLHSCGLICQLVPDSVNLAGHNWCFWLFFDCLWIYHCRWSWLAFSNNCMCNFNCNWKYINRNCNSNWNIIKPVIVTL